MPDYSKGKIYKILCVVSDDVYVGSTCQALSKRWASHRCNIDLPPYYKNKFYCKIKELGCDNFYIELIENFPCSTREELRAKEGEWIRKISTLNKLIAGRDSKGYYDDNAERLKQKSKDYSADHKEQIKEYMKVYRVAKQEEIKEKRTQYCQDNRDKMKAYKQQPWECECGITVMTRSRKDHLRSKRHEERMKLKMA